MRDKRLRRITSAAMAAILSASSVMPYMAAEPDAVIPIEASSEAEVDAPAQEPVKEDGPAENTAATEVPAPTDDAASGEATEAPKEEGEKAAEPGKAEEEKAEDGAEANTANPYILFLPKADGVAYEMDTAHVSSEYSAEDYTVLLYGEGEQVSLGITTDYEVSVVSGDSVVFSDEAFDNGKISFAMPAQDLEVRFAVPETEPAPETELLPASEKPEETQEVQEKQEQEHQADPAIPEQTATEADAFEQIEAPDTDAVDEMKPETVEDVFGEEETEAFSEEMPEAVTDEAAEEPADESVMEEIETEGFDQTGESVLEENETEGFDQTEEFEEFTFTIPDDEEEQEDEEEDGTYSVYVMDDDDINIHVIGNEHEFEPGEEVLFEVKSPDYYDVNGVYVAEAEMVGDAEDPESYLVTGNVLMSEEKTSEEQDLDGVYSFTMPANDVTLLAGKDLAAGNVSVKLDNKRVIYVPAGWRAANMPYANTTIRTVTVKSENRGDTGKDLRAYCFQPKIGGPDEKTFTASPISTGLGISKDAVEKLNKDLFYLFKGPAWSVGGDDTKTTKQIKKLLKSCKTDDDYFIATHFIASRIFSDDWNVLITGGNTYNNPINSTGVNEIKAVQKYLNSLPAPSASLSRTASTAKYNEATKTATTDTFKYTCNISENTLSMTVPDGCTMYIVGDKTPKAAKSKVTIAPGKSFYFTMSNYTTKQDRTVKLTAAIFTVYQGYVVTQKNRQVVGFGGVPDRDFSISLTFPAAPKNGSISVKKESSNDTVGAVYSMKGAVITVYKEDGSVYNTITLDDNGEGSLENVPAGKYTLKETQGPSNNAYKILPAAENSKEAVLTGSSSVEWNIIEEPWLVDLPIKKDVSELVNGRGMVEGITFTANGPGGVSITSDPTDASGSTVIEDLFIGEWTLSENVPEDISQYYEGMDEYSFTVSLNTEKTAAVTSIDGGTFHAVNSPHHAYLAIAKVDASDENKFVPGAKLQVLNSEGNPVELTPRNGTKAGAFTSGTDYIHFEESIPAGSYRLHEVEAPKGYKLTADDVPFTITVDNTETTVSVKIADPEIKKTISVTKVDEETGNKCGAGYSFEIHAAETIKDLNGNVREVNGKRLEKDALVETITTGDDSIATSSELYLGSYYVIESAINQHDGYTLNTNKYPVVLEDTQEPSQPLNIPLDIPNTPNKVKIVKIDAATGEPLSGVEFELKRNGETMGKRTTNDEGLILDWTKLPANSSYTLQETKTLEDYILNDTVFNFSTDKNGLINGEKEYTVTVENVPKNGVIAVKKSSSDAKIGAIYDMTGAVVTVYNEDGTKYKDIILDKNGNGAIKDVPNGKYFLKETAAPSNKAYKMVPDAQNSYGVTIDGGSSVEWKFTEEPKKMDLPVNKSISAPVNGESAKWIKGIVITATGPKNTKITATTDDNGKAQLTGLFLGNWTITETLTAEQAKYFKTVAPITVKINAVDGSEDLEASIGDVKIESVDIENKPEERPVKIAKKETGTENLIPGASLQILDASGKAVSLTEKGKTAKTDTFTSGTAYIEFEEQLPAGSYKLHEAKAPEGYKLAADVPFEITASTAATGISVDAKDAPIMKKISVTKIDEVTKAKCGPGYVFEVRAAADIVDGAGNVRTQDRVKLTAGAVVQRITTGDDSIATTKDLYIGKYEIQEVKVNPEHGYTRNTKVYTVEITDDKTNDQPLVVDIEIPNTPNGLEILKTDSESGSSIDGIKFAIYADGELWKEVTTENGGKIYEGKLPADTEYMVKEVETLPDYFLNESEFEFATDKDGLINGKTVYTLNITNVPKKGRIAVKKSVTDAKVGAIYDLTGAVVTVYNKKDGTRYADITLDKDGNGSLSDVPRGEYVLKETKAPSNKAYKITTDNANSYNVTISGGDTVTWNFTEEPKKIDLPVNKSITATVDGETEKWIKGIVITAVGPKGTQITATTDEKGKATISGLFLGDWTITETLTAEQAKYFTVASPVTVKITAAEGSETLEASIGEVKVESVNIENKPVQRPVRIAKKDTDNGNFIPGASLQILDYNGAPVSLTVKGEAEKASTFTSTDDYLEFEETLQAGSYTLHEAKAPYGYKLADDVAFIINADTPAEGIAVDANDAPLMKKISVTKVDEKTGKTCGAGYVFEITAGEDIVDGAGNIRTMNGTELKEGTVVDTITTGDDSIARSKDLYLGYYLVREIRINPEDGLTLNTSPYPVTLTDEQKGDQPMIVDIEIENTPNEIEIIKTDKESGQPVDGITFEIYAGEDLFLRDKTKDGGKLYVGYLPANTVITIREVETIPEYYLNDEVFTVTTDENGKFDGEITYTLEVENVPKRGKIAIKKSSSDENIGKIYDMAGAVVTVYDGDNDLYATITLDENGEGLLDDLPFDTYTVKETQAPANKAYKITVDDDNEKIIEINSDATITWEFTEQPKLVDLPIQKKLSKTVNGKTQEWIEGILFTAVGPNGTTVTATTDSEGKAVLKDLFLGEWTVTETLTKDQLNYFEAAEPVDINVEAIDGSEELSVKEDGIEIDTLTVTNAPVERHIKIAKQDSDSKSLIPGAVLQILDHAGEALSLTVKGSEDEANEFTSAEDYLEFEETISAGSYTLHEVKAPNGYILGEDVPFEIDSTTEEDAVIALEVVDKPLMKKLSVTKIDKETGKKCGPGYVFEVKAAEDIVDGAGKVREQDGVALTAGTLVDTITTGDDSIATTKNLHLGKYTVSESAINQKDGLTINKEAYEFELTDEESEDQPMIFEMNIDNKPNELRILKKDTVNGNPVAGVTFELTVNGSEKETFVTDENGFISKKYLPANSSFTVQETATIPGYNLNDEVFSFETDECGLIDGKDYYEIEVTNQPNTVEFSKKSAVEGDDGEEIPGATLVITDANGNEVDKWVSTDEPHIVYGMVAGTYTLTETLPPVGYELGETVEFTVTDTLQVQKVTMKDPPYREVQISKQEIAVTEDGEESPEIPGAHLELADAEGNIVEAWVSTEEPHKVVIPSGVYTLTERKPADGYVTAETITFTVEKREEEGDYVVDHVIMRDDTTKTYFHKKSFVDGEGGNEIPGATLRITDNDGNLVEEWVSTDEPHFIEKLPIGFYTLTEITAPDGYEKSESVRFEVKDTGEVQHVTMFDAPYREVEISKRELVKGKGGDEIPGAHLEITSSDGKEVIESWVSTDEPHMVSLPSGSYILTERKPADGYVTAESIAFTVVRREHEGDYEVQPVEMLDDVTKVQITKSDITDGKPVIGAVLVIKDSKGKEVARWTTTAEPHYIEKLPIGKYTLTEITAPDGYEVAETIKFEVKDTPKIQKVDMKDAPSPVTTKVTPPQTGDDWNGTPLVIALAVIAVLLGAGVILVKKKKK